MYGRFTVRVTGVLISVLFLAACPIKKSAPPKPTPKPRATADARSATPVPTVPPGTPVAMPTRPIANPNVKATKGKPIGPIVSHFGAARADGHAYEPDSVDKDGVATYKHPVGSGFMIVIEGKPGLSNAEVGRSIFQYDPKDPKKRPDVQLESNRPLGDGSDTVCDRNRPEIGGVPAVNPPSFKETQAISDTLNDLACRFETFVESASSCTVTANGDFSFINKESTTQFCMVIAKAWNFPIGTTELTLRLRDVDGNPGPEKKLRLIRSEPPKRTPSPKGTPGPRKKPTPKPLPTR